MTALDYQTPLPLTRTPGHVFARLCAMMFLQFFIWGAWYVSMGPFMATSGMTAKIGVAYTLCPIAAMISPFFLGIVADRFFSSERVLAVLHLLGAAAMFATPAVAQHGAAAFLAIILLHSLCYMPTINLTNSVAFTHLTDQEKQFPLIRVFGTLGWIAANWLISGIGADKSATQFYIAGGAAAALGLFSLALPHTPPPAKGKRASVREIIGLDALSLFRSRSFAVFALSSFLICIPLAAYYSFAAKMVGDVLAINDPANTNPPIAAWMSIGQAAEVGFMLVMPLFFRKLGVKWMLSVGMLSWVARYALFAAGVTGPAFWMIMLGVALHGLCYDFFFVTGFIYTDKRASKQIRGQAQGLVVFLTYGVGLAIGGYVSGLLYNGIVGDATGRAALPLFARFWMYPAAFALGVLVLFTLLFRDDTHEPPIGPSEKV
jgi:nucleoside transporter